MVVGGCSRWRSRLIPLVLLYDFSNCVRSMEAPWMCYRVLECMTPFSARCTLKRSPRRLSANDPETAGLVWGASLLDNAIAPRPSSPCQTLSTVKPAPKQRRHECSNVQHYSARLFLHVRLHGIPNGRFDTGTFEANLVVPALIGRSWWWWFHPNAQILRNTPPRVRVVRVTELAVRVFEGRRFAVLPNILKLVNSYVPSSSSRLRKRVSQMF